jgi:predicted MFS family arabinose efflux permease
MMGPQSVGLLFAYAGLINVFIQAFLLEWCSERHLLIAGLLLLAGGYAGLSICHTVTVTLAFLTLNNIGGAVSRPVITSLISKRTPPERQGLAMGVNQPVMATTSMAAPLLAGFLIKGNHYVAWALSAAVVAFIGVRGSVKMPKPS